ncbi:NUDIX domain-containing protein [Modestobacter sp. I12A-02628]|uniref:NUDIX hydrolase n=1 Tax=Goekera deserti TaxID=2497753 RepID=A0A7K3WJD6_9ACTN|nr:NUDIX hydrolase [Goekera deserti]MPQ97773.1 NUDIX domain-containing protein [Goekera deserti]NDI48418.1 NUDIX domain-containing protein [Goekera deserti]NEL56019.1 NUDIX hydrolase [Goekera deserti]
MSTADRPGEAEWLAGYRPGDHDRPSLTVDLAVFTIRDGAFSVLLVERGEHPYRGHWALPGGFVGIEEDIEAAAWRELAEETGVARFDGHLEQLRTYGAPGRDPRMRVVSVAHVAIAPDLPDPRAGSDAAAARWWPVEDLGLDGGDPDAPPLAFDHATVLTDAVERVRAKLEYTSLALEFLREPFSLGDVRRIYRAVWGRAPALGHFRRKVLSTPGFVVETHQVSSSPASDHGGRPPLLFRRGTATQLHPALLRPTGTDEE